MSLCRFMNYQLHLMRTGNTRFMLQCCRTMARFEKPKPTPKGHLEFGYIPATKVDFDELNSDVFAKIHEQLEERSHGRLFAIVHFHTHQRKVTLNDIVLMQRETECTIGDRIRLNKVMLVGSKDFTVIGRPLLSGDVVKVEGTVIEKTLSQTLINSWYKKGFRPEMHLQRVPYTYVRIDRIVLNPQKFPKS